MLGYRDMTFCTNKECADFGDRCLRSLTEEVSKAADAWWGKGEGQAPIWQSEFTECFVEKKG